MRMSKRTGIGAPVDHKIKKEEKRMESLNQSKRKDGPGKNMKENIKNNLCSSGKE